MGNEFAKTIGEGFKDKNKLTTQVSRHLMKEEVSDRRSDCIHPSEASHEHWCPRSTYYRIAGYEAVQAPRSLSMEMVFETGHDAHRKWQTWFREMGVLNGDWRCRVCSKVWSGVSPTSCPRCESGGHLIDYAEFPVSNDDYLLAGQSDGDVIRPDGTSTLIEIKTIGTGTVRYDAPSLMAKYSYHHFDDSGKIRTGVDWQALWNGIKRPFSSHLRQGMIYCFCSGRDEITYIYDPKFITAHPKEFSVKYDRVHIEGILEQCLTVKDGLEKQSPPDRPDWAEKSCRTCSTCPFKKECYGNDANNRFDGPNFPKPFNSKNRFEAPKLISTPAPRVRFTELTPQSY